MSLNAGLDDAVRTGLAGAARRDIRRGEVNAAIGNQRREEVVEGLAAPVGAYLGYKNARYQQPGDTSLGEDLSAYLGKATRGINSVFRRSFWTRPQQEKSDG